jgi:hypothetical protein
MRQLTIIEKESCNLISISPGVYIKGIEKSDPPPMPDDGMAYELREITKLSDAKQQFIWVPMMLEE